jgi:hypothetical protein
MKILLFICSDIAMIDARNNRASLINVIEELSAPGFPAVHPILNIFALVERNQNEPMKSIGKLKLTFDGQNLVSTKIDIDFQGKTRTRAIATIQGLVFEKPGTMIAELRIGNSVSKWTAPVITLAPPMITAPLKGTMPHSETNVGAKRPRRAAKKRVAKKH